MLILRILLTQFLSRLSYFFFSFTTHQNRSFRLINDAEIKKKNSGIQSYLQYCKVIKLVLNSIWM